MPAGRPTDYDPEYHPAKAYEFCSDLAFTDVKLARLFDVSKATITNWKKAHPEFLASIKGGKDEYDSDKAERCLMKRVEGFRYTETTKELSPAPNPKTGEGQLIVTKKVRKQVAPDPTSMIFWLKNRNPGRWRDKRDIEVEGELNINLIDSFSEEGNE